MELTLNEALAKLKDTTRLTDDDKANKLFFDGDHWQDGKGFPALAEPGEVDDYAGYLLKVKKAFCSENKIKAIVSRAADGVTGREPDWNLVEENPNNSTEARKKQIEQILAALVKWWNDREILKTVFREANTAALLQRRAIIRAYLPEGFVSDAGKVEKQKDLVSALGMLHFEVVSPDNAGVFREPSRLEAFGIFTQDDGKNSRIEICYTDEKRLSRLRVFENESWRSFGEKTLPTLATYFPEQGESAVFSEIEPIDLGGNLLMFELSQEQIIDESVRSLQKQLNLSHTMDGKNVYIAGSRERYFLNAQPPTKTTEKISASGQKIKTEESVPLRVGGSSATFLGGQPIYNVENGKEKLVGFANANLIIVDPVSGEVFRLRREDLRSAILDAANQSHVEINADATASGRSRKESRAAFETALNKSKANLDALGRWLLEVALRFAVAHCTEQIDVRGLRFDFNCQIDAGPVDPSELTLDAADVEAGRMTLASYLVKKGVEDPDAEIAALKSAEDYDLIQLGKAAEVAQKSEGVISLALAVQMSAMTREGKDKILAEIQKVDSNKTGGGLPIQK